VNDASPFRVTVVSAELVESFTGLICDGRDAEAAQRVEHLLTGGVPPETIMRELLGPAARLMGEHWCQDHRDFLEVTVGMARLQQLVRQFRPSTTAHTQLRGHALLVAVPGEQHTFGLRLVEEHLLRADWQVSTCMNASEADITRLVAEEAFDFVGFSLSSERLLPALRSAIRSLRTSSRNQHVRIAVGGVLFDGRDIAPWDIDADAIMLDAEDAVNQAAEWSGLVGME
jgi:MerR family transcriptional regulator, light-induced transcriptional regulator